MEDEKRILLAENIYLSYSELPTKKGCRKGFLAKVNNRSCIVFRKNASISALKFLMNHFPEVQLLSEVKQYTNMVFDCFISHGYAYVFNVIVEGVENKMIAFILEPLWDTVDTDFVYLINYIRYCKDYAENPDGTFMDDYGLC